MLNTLVRALPILVLLCVPAAAQQQAPPAAAHPLDALFEEIEELRETVGTLREALAQAKLETARAERERDELWHFIQDHDRLGPDFEQYRAVKAAAEQEAQRQRIEESRKEREAERVERQERYRAARAERARKEAEMQRVQEFREAGFTPLGFDIYMSKAAYNYGTADGLTARYDWNGLTGTFIRVYPWADRIDFSSMTISGSVLNASEVVRDIGIAVTFFDEAGSQVGGEIIQVNNARPDVPYPFTATIEMALDRPFASTSTYVLYADPA
jgi:hypothetical protein